MFDTKPKILEYHENLVQEIDLHTERIILKLSKSNGNEIEISKCNQVRESFVTEINKFQNSNLALLSQGCTNQYDYTYCYFIPNFNTTILNTYEPEPYFYYPYKFHFNNPIGKLVVLKLPLSYSNLIFFIYEINHVYSTNPMEDCKYMKFQDYAECYVLFELLNNGFKDLNPIIYLNSPEHNVVECLCFQTDEVIQTADFSRYQYLINVEMVKQIKLKNQEATEIPKKMFQIFPNLSSILLDGLKSLRKIDKEAFTGLQNLTKLVLKNSNVTKLRGNVFKQLVNLKEIRIINSSLETISVNAFNGLKSLEKLDLSSNRLLFIRNHYFTGLTNLTRLVLTRNKINIIDPLAFKCLKQLKYVDISSNQIEASTKDLFKFNKNIETLIDE